MLWHIQLYKGHRTSGGVVEPASKVDSVADNVEKEQDLVGRPTHDESTADHQWRDGSIASDLDGRRRGRRVHLNSRRSLTTKYKQVSKYNIATCSVASWTPYLRRKRKSTQRALVK